MVGCLSADQEIIGWLRIEVRDLRAEVERLREELRAVKQECAETRGERDFWKDEGKR